MYFHTLPFLIFFLIVYPAYLAVKGTKLRLPLLLAASYIFYAWLNPLYLVLIAYSTALDYWVVTRMARSPRRKSWLAISIANNLGLLGFFKYGTFVTDNVNLLLSSLNIPYEVPSPGMLLPVGLSFYIFQSLSYTIDYYRGNVEKETSLVTYATFVALFPRLLAGPIERAKNLLPQLHKAPKVCTEDITDGLSLFIVGLFKKIALADYLALYVNKVYATPDQFQSPALILATIFRLQRLHRHGARRREDDGLSPDAELQPPVSGRKPRRLLVEMAYKSLHLVQGLPVHSSRRKSQRNVQHLQEYVPGHGDFRPVARRGMDVCHLGRPARPRAILHARIGKDHLLQRKGPEIGQTTSRVRFRHLRLDILPSREYRRRPGDSNKDIQLRMGESPLSSAGFGPCLRCVALSVCL